MEVGNKTTNRAATLVVLAFVALLVGSKAFATSQGEMRQILSIARGISAVQPFLPSSKYISYGIAIHRASKRFTVHPALLIAIAQQESGFRENLPEGPAGEIGVCQILKSWLNNPELKRAFGKLTVRDLKRPSISFQISAWILQELEGRVDAGPLPFWSFYNSPNFKHRLAYYKRVSTKMLAMKKAAPEMFAEHLLYGPGRKVASVPVSFRGENPIRVGSSRGRLSRAPIANSRLPRVALHRQKRIGVASGMPQESLIKAASIGGYPEEPLQD